jgi:hypothetical protein
MKKLKKQEYWKKREDVSKKLYKLKLKKKTMNLKL